MGSIGGMLGTAGGAGGSGFKGPQDTSLQQGLTPAQVQQSNELSQQNLAAQNRLLSAIQSQNSLGAQTKALNSAQGLQSSAQQQGQSLQNQLAANNGIANQGSVFNQTQGLANQLGAANGVGTQNAAISGLQNVAGQQQDLANMYGAVATGQGPNPAQAMLNQATGANVANQAALMAGQRGASANVGLLARQAAQQGAATQQQAVGQAATQQATQQLNAMQGMGAQQQQMAATQQAIGGMGTTQAQMLAAQQAALAGQAQQQIGNQLSQQNQAFQQNLAANQAAAGQANAMAGQQLGQTNANTAAAQNQQNMGLNALGNVNTNQVNMQGNINSANAGMTTARMGQQGDMIGGMLKGGGAAMGMAAHGGYVGMAEGGYPMAPAAPAPQPMMPAPVTQPPPGPQSAFGQFLAGGNTGNYLVAAQAEQDKTPDTTAANQFKLDPKDSQLSQGTSAITQAGAAAMMARTGGYVAAKSPEEKAVKPGNSYANDKIKALLSEGEIVLPRTVTQSEDPVRSAADFVAKVMAKRKVKSA